MGLRDSGHGLWLPALLAALALPCVPADAAARDLPERRLLVRDRDSGRLPSVRLDRRELRRAERRGEKFRLRRFPLRRDLEVTLELERFDVTTPRTRFVLGRKTGPDQELRFDPSQVALYRGRVEGRAGSRVVLALHRGGHTGQIDLGPGEPRFWVSSRGRRGEALEPDRAVVFEAAGAGELPPNVPFCGVEGGSAAQTTVEPVEPLGPLALSGPADATGPAVGLAHLELAVDTDHEFFQLFGDASEAAAYLVALYGQVSDIYLRDVDTRVELVFARLWDTPDDLFNEVDPSPLGEFRDVWNATMGGISRDVAQLLSGRRDYPFGGQAYLSTVCTSNAYGVVGYALGSFPDPSKPSPFSYDVSVTAHELAHNAGTAHTHDSPNFVDSCDDPLSTPQRGTIMSYCAQTWSGGNANRDLYFHSRIQDNLDALLSSSACIVDDCNMNGVADALDISGSTSSDSNGNGIPDECEDCNENGTLDPADIAMGAPDVDGDGIPDECEPDCNVNGVPDDEDIALGTSLDAYGNDVPDECEADCDASFVSDYTEIQLDMTLDVDRNARLDACQDCDVDGTGDLDELGGAGGIWLASGLDPAPLRHFYASTGVLDATSGGAPLGEAQDLILTPDLRVLVTSAVDSSVAEFDIDGNRLVDLVASGSGGLAHAAGLVLAPNGDLLVVSRDTNEVLAYDATTGAFLGVFVSAGLGGLALPFGLTFGPNGNLYVTTDAGGVIEYDGSTGALVGTFVDPADNGGLDSPRGLVFKPDGNLLVTSFATDETLEFRRDTGFPLGRWAKSGDFSQTRLTQESPWGIRIGPTGNVFIVRTGEAFGSGGGGSHGHGEGAALHLTNAQMYEFDVRNGNFLRAHINGNDHGVEFPTGFDFVPAAGTDCNGNQLQDDCDVASGASQDADGNGVPDECEVDCNANGNPDRLDIIPFGSSTDCNANLVPDECDVAAQAPAACETGAETACTDGFDNDRDGLPDCADADCDATGACLGEIVAAVTFDADAELFGYVDDPFRGTSQPAYASGAHGPRDGFEGGGGLGVSLGGIDGAGILGMSGGWQRSFTLAAAADVSLTFRYLLEQTPTYESDEYSQVLVSVDGVLVGIQGNDYVAQITGDGQSGVGQVRSTGWQTVVIDLGSLGVGPHTLVIGGYNNKKTVANEETQVRIDDVGLFTVLPPVCGDGILSPGEDCDDGGTQGGDCCSGTCGFEGSGSPCDDADACTEPDACDGAGLCVGSPVSCDDGNPCTAESCDAVTGCRSDPIPGCGGFQPEVPAAGLLGRVGIGLVLGLTSLAALRSPRPRPSRNQKMSQ